jgi:hypothetical protein
MTTFCDIQLPSNISETQKAYRTKKTSDSGHTRIRSSGRIPKKEFSLQWDFLPSADKATLGTFFENNQSAEFTWTHFETGITYTVYFVSDEIKYEYAAVGYWKAEMTIGEL